MLKFNQQCSRRRSNARNGDYGASFKLEMLKLEQMPEHKLRLFRTLLLSKK